MHDEQNAVGENDQDVTIEPKGIAGWLIIPAILLVWSPIAMVVDIVQGIRIIQIFTPELPELMSDLWLSYSINLAIIVATVVAAVLFFKKRRIAVPAFVGLMAAYIVASIIQAFLSAAILQEIDVADIIDSVGRSCVQGAVWIPYFLKSKRVKNTFVN